MKKMFLLVLLTISMQHLAAQKEGQELIDSLKSELQKAKQDTDRVNILYEISDASEDDQDVLEYAQQSLQLAEKINFKNGIANALNNVAYVNISRGDMAKALECYQRALSIYEEINNKQGAGDMFNGIGYIYFNQGDILHAHEYYQKSLKIQEELGNKELIALLLNNIAGIYKSQGDYQKVLDYHLKSIKIKEEIGDKPGISMSFNNIGAAYVYLGDYPKALEYYQKSLKMRQESGDKKTIAQSLNNIGGVYGKMNKLDEAFDYISRALKIQEEIGDKLGVTQSLNDIGGIYAKQKKYKEAESYSARSLKMAKELGYPVEIRDISIILSDVFAAQGKFKDAYAMHRLFKQMADSVSNSETRRSTIRKEMQYEFEKKEAAAKAEQDKKDALVKEEVKRQQNIRNSSFAGLGGLLLFTLVVVKQRNKIKKGKQRSDELLLNILPAETAEELKTKGSAEAKSYDEVTVLFTDFKNFTQASEKLPAVELVKEIHHCYSEFDRIIEKHNLEKIKTIGDSYMCAGGLPVANKTNALDTVRAALEIQQFMTAYLQSASPLAKAGIGLRAGIHTGPVVAGIVGVKKFAYDIWGDTVNIASRMESSGEAGKVNISGSTYELVKDKFKCEHRGKIQAKNKGEIDMYFVEQPV